MRYEGELKGKARQVKGTAKEQLGKLVGNPDLQEQGSDDRLAGKVQEKAGKAKRKIGEAVEDLGDKIAG